ncbi:MAG: DUF1015 domain-containing protein [Nitrososphaerales archaeon]
MTEGVQIPTVLLPRPSVDLYKWAVIACDQFTSEPEYWAEVARIVGHAPSTYHITLPEVYLDTPEEPVRVQSIKDTMHSYLDQGLFEEFEGIVLVERTVSGESHSKTRHGIMLALDLEQYDYAKGSTSLIRATEGTILERIPPRVRIRSGAPLELPHILVLIDDSSGSVIEPLVAQKESLRRLYDVDLMLDSGHLTGYAVEDQAAAAQVLAALAALGQPEVFASKYGLPAGTPPLVCAMGDGNHSLATAKAIWEDLKRQAGGADAASGDDAAQAPLARYALVEIENIHDEGLEFEPIFRVLFEVKQDLAEALDRFYPDRYRLVRVASTSAMTNLVDSAARESAGSGGAPDGGAVHAIGVFSPQACHVLYVSEPPSNLPAGTLQAFLDAWAKEAGFAKIDYVHGLDVTERLGCQPGNLGFYLPAIDKSSFFKTVIVDGALPRKTFSMGEAREKRFYMEARRIA